MAIELDSVRYRYAGSASAALGPIELRLEPGRVVGVAGANESGKTTLCLVTAGLARPSSAASSTDRSASMEWMRPRCGPTSWPSAAACSSSTPQRN